MQSILLVLRKEMINNLATKQYLWVVLLLVSTVGLIAFDIPVLRQIAGFISLTFVPGLLLLHIFRLNKLGAIETLLYSVGLSIALVMFTGFFMNVFYPLIGISRPISLLPVIATITLVVLILCFIAYKQKGSLKEPLPQDSSKPWAGLLSPPALLLLLLPVLSALGAFWVYLRQGNILLLVLLSLIALVVTLVAFGKFIPTKLYPLAILAISISLLWHWSLISPGLTAFDINHEYYLQKLVLSNSVWNYARAGAVNAMLSIVMLAPIYSLLLHLDTVWLFKIFYPLLFSLVPLALFQGYKRQTSDKIAFLAVFFFMSWTTFFADAGGNPRQAIAELFLALSILAFLDKEMGALRRTSLLIIFGLSLVVSHYGTSYIYMLYLLMALPLLSLWRSTIVNRLKEGKVTRFSKFRHRVIITHQLPKLTIKPRLQSTLTGTYVILFIVFCLAWYMYVSSSSPLTSIVKIGDHIYHSLSTDLFVLEARDQQVVQALGLMPMRGREVEWEIARIIQYITQFFIVVGVLGLIANWRKTRFYPEFAAMSLATMVILAICVILPQFANQLNMSRIYHLTLFFLAPFCILGGIATFRWLSRILRLRWLQSNHTALKLVVILVVVPYFLFTTGFIFELTGATPTSRALSLYRADWAIMTEPEIRASKWLANVAGGENFRIYADAYGGGALYQELGGRIWRLPPAKPIKSAPSYIFLRHWNIAHNEVILFRIVGVQEVLEHVNITSETELSEALKDMSKIYDNRWAQVLGPR